ncbi:Methylamine utilisation protein MauE [Desulfuromusa kysingii]|uniref:Methylamine utilisation protein MauE n=1 Tax=Desulfuromusa kysingii TaxID=37625 RepID=A0A1H3VXE2_9BACT|nr:MauE/DoxX family redox-associated membrane protein [Desulfuromusa kysingii]SDZ79525.1 Methylamine utilisation protein MauE [Desulfuromusa kysingii]
MSQIVNNGAIHRLTNRLSSPPGRWCYHLLKLVLVIVFLWSGISKAIHPLQFAEIIGAYGLLPEVLIFPVAISLISLEIIAAIGLIFDKRGSLSLITLMMILFMGILIYGITLGLDIDCGCFGPEDPEAEAFHNLRGALYRDFSLMFAIVYLYLWRFTNRLTPSPWWGHGDNQAQTKEV